jgi:uncharacterized repeat protein (TIGR01451 family)
VTRRKLSNGWGDAPFYRQIKNQPLKPFGGNIHMNKKIYTKYMLVLLGLLTILVVASLASGKSLYVNIDLNANSPISAYDIQGPPNYLVYQMTSSPTKYGGAGLAIDTDSEILFVTFEGYSTIDIVDAKTLNLLGQVTAPNSDDLAGIVVDQDKQKVYTVDRNTDHLYVYSWDATTKTLTNDVTTAPYYIMLPDIYYTGGHSAGLHGIALDETNDILYACDVSTTVKIYNTADWSLADTFNVTQPPMGIAIDVANGFAYTGNAYGPYGSLGLLSKYDLNTDIEYTSNIRNLTGYNDDNCVGLAVDPATSRLYITTGSQGYTGSDRLMVFDSDLTFLYQTSDIGNPTGIAIPGKEISYNPLNLTKDDNVGDGQCVNLGGNINYTICFDNLLNQQIVNNIEIVDTLPPETTFITASNSGVYDSSNHTVTWQYANVSAGSAGYCNWVQVTVDPGTTPGTTITNSVVIDSDETPPTTQSETTDICEGGGGDTDPPIQTFKIGQPQTFREWYQITYPVVSCATPIWINSTDPGGVGTDRITYSVWNAANPHPQPNGSIVFTFLYEKTVYDGDPEDINPATGEVSIEIYMQESCIHQVIYQCWDLNENTDGQRDKDFIVDCLGPNTTKEIGQPQYGLGSPNWVNLLTPFWFNSTDVSCLPYGMGVDYIHIEVYWKRNCSNTSDPWKLNETIEIFDNDQNDLDPTIGNISYEYHFNDDCCHELRWYGMDIFGNKETPKKQKHYVDITPPDIIKTIGDPNCIIVPGLVYCVTNETLITFYANDDGCMGGVGLMEMEYRVWNTQDGWSDWINDDDLDGESIQFTEDCTHYLEIMATDLLGNTYTDNETFYVDTLEPLITKTIGNPKLPYNIGKPINTDYWVSCQTPITINATDQGCCDQLAAVWYNINKTGWTQIPLSSLPYTITFDEDCMHTLDIKAEDCLGNTAYHNETFYVDCTPPDLNKTIGNPNCPIIPELEYCVTQETPIIFIGEDKGCQGGVGVKELKYRIWNETHGWGDWQYADPLQPEWYYFTEECTHYLHIVVTDYMNNTFEDNETFYVDDTYPKIEKIIGDPNCTIVPGQEYCVKTDTPIWINASDPGCCTSLTVKIQYGNDTWNSGWMDITTQLPYTFNFTEECWHYLHIWAYDCLGHETHDNQSFYVDDTPPDIIKTVGDPNCTCDLEEGDYCVTMSTEISLEADNQGCCNSEFTWIKYRIWYNGTWTDWTDYIEPFTFTEECMHYLEVMAGDCLNNTAYDNETFYVDETPPDIIKTVGDPNCICGVNPGDYCINMTTPISIAAIDGCCPCEIPTIEYKVWYDETWTDWMPYTGTFTFDEECMHKLSIRAIDCLGNTAYDNETFYVDDTPPELIKKVGEPNFTKDNKTWWVTTETEINLTGIEHGCCPCPYTTITYRIWYQGQWSDWILYIGNFTFAQGCTHYLEVKVEDCVGNYVIDNETFIVHGPSGPSGPTIEITYPIHGETYSQQIMEIIIHAYDGQTSWENLKIDLWQPGGRRDAPTLWYDVMLGDTQDYYKAYVDLFCYQDGAEITLWASAIDEDGNVQFALPVTFTVHTTTIWDQWMQPGWNLLILPPNLGCDESIPRILYSINGSYDFVFHLDADDGWISYWTEDTSNELTHIEGGKQYWIHINDTKGLRYYLALTEIKILTPENNDQLTDLPEINGITWNSQISITDVYINLYYKDGMNQKHYWNGSAWVSIAVNLDCTTDLSYPMGWYYNSSAVTWTPGTTYYIKAVANDEGGCTAVDMVLFSIVGQCIPQKIYTVNADFDEGILNGVEHDTIADQLQLIPGQVTTYPSLWIANAGEDSLSKWDTENNRELARYHTWFGSLGNHGAWTGPAPSRTCVDSDGNCYVANRHFDTYMPDVIKVYTDDWVDRNGNGVLDTSYDANDNGVIESSEMLQMTDLNSNGVIDDNEITDERIAWATQVNGNGKGRSLAIDLEGNIWLGCYDSYTYYKLDGDTGAILGGPYSVGSHTPYGALVDKYGYLWGSSLGSNILKLNTSDPTDYTIYSVPSTYGMALGYDSMENTLVYCGGNSPFVIFNSSSESYSYPTDTFDYSLPVAVDSQGDIVTGSYYDGSIAKYAPNGTIIWQVAGQVNSEVRGIVYDSDDNIWAIHRDTSKLCKYDGTNGSYLGIYDAGLYPYTYSDATGIGFAQSITSGSWKVVFDTLQANTTFDTITWSSFIPDNTSITVRIRSSADQISWSSWETADNGVLLSSTPAAQYLEIEVSFKMIATETSPILYDLTVTATCGNG